MKAMEKSYSFVFKKLLKTINPVKKRIKKAECIVHIYINNQAVIILENDGYKETSELMKKYIEHINEGVVFADQDLKSSNHFYNPHRQKGLYGSENAKSECIRYYNNALEEYEIGNIEKAMFYLGAACHLIQDLTVPQHATVKLLNRHKSYENWVVRTHRYYDEFTVSKGGIYFDYLVDYIEYNSREAIKIHMKNLHVENRQVRFHRISSKGLTMAQSTTAGVMETFFRDTQKYR